MMARSMLGMTEEKKARHSCAKECERSESMEGAAEPPLSYRKPVCYVAEFDGEDEAGRGSWSMVTHAALLQGLRVWVAGAVDGKAALG